MTKQKGFSLVELMIVVAIIGILFSIAAPKIKQMRNGGKLLEKTYEEYTLSSGKKVECSNTWRGECGLNLYDCRDGQEYVCQTNVIKSPLKIQPNRSVE